MHNFIQKSNANDLAEDLDQVEPEQSAVNDGERAAAQGDEEQGESPIPFDFSSAASQRNFIAREMWRSYTQALCDRGQELDEE